MPNILIVDDNRMFRRALNEILSAHLSSVDITEAGDGEAIREKIEIQLPDLIFMDVALPGESGLQLTKKIKAEHPQIPILILTNYDTPEYREAATIAGADGFLSKRLSTPQEIASAAKSIISPEGAHSD
jgi:DNA-binding NarL/FixJ family response regulator